MPVVFHEELYPPGEWGLFRITEEEAQLRGQVLLFAEELEQLSRIRGAGHRREFLAARLLLHQMSGRQERGELYKDEAGKPHLRDSHFYVSISHTVEYAAAIAHPFPCGIDVQRIVPKITRLAHKFVSPAERVQLKRKDELLQLHLIWSAKEAMYKAFGRRQLDFKDHLYVDFHDFHPNRTTASAMLTKDRVTMVFDLEFRTYPEQVLVACVERQV